MEYSTGVGEESGVCRGGSEREEGGSGGGVSGGVCEEMGMDLFEVIQSFASVIEEVGDF